MYKVTVDHPNIGETDLYIHGLGTFRNGTTTEVEDEQVERFRSMNSVVNVSDPHPETGNRTPIPARGMDPTKLNIFGVKVEKVGGDDE
jgi:hypothetical protein